MPCSVDKVVGATPELVCAWSVRAPRRLCLAFASHECKYVKHLTQRNAACTGTRHCADAPSCRKSLFPGPGTTMHVRHHLSVCKLHHYVSGNMGACYDIMTSKATLTGPHSECSQDSGTQTAK